MTVKEFAQEVLEHVENNVCYLAIMPNDEGYDIEVEVNGGSIAGNYATGTHDLEQARQIANSIEKQLNYLKIEVFDSRDEWEDYLAN